MVAVSGFNLLRAPRYRPTRSAHKALQCLCLFAFWRCGVAFELGRFYDLAIIGVALMFIWHLWLIRSRDTARCFIAFNQSKWIGLIVLAGLCAHFWLGDNAVLSAN